MREILSNVLIESGILVVMKLVRLIIMCLLETYGSQVGKNMCYITCLEYSERRCLITIACQVREVAVEWGQSGFIYYCYSFVGLKQYYKKYGNLVS